MFETFSELKQLFSIDVFSMLDQVFSTSNIQKTMIEFNQDQLQDGKDVNERPINTIGGSPYRPTTIRIRMDANLPTNRVTLKFTGAFYKTFQIQIVKEGYSITADFEKEDGSILDNFSDEFDFLGLDKEGLNELANQYVYPELSRLIRQKYGLR